MKRRDVIESLILLIVIFTGSLSKDEVFKFIKDYQSIVAVTIGSTIASVIAVRGWVRAYEFNNKVQDQRLKNDITNTARKEIAEAIRAHQKWLINVAKNLDDMMEGIKNNSKKPWLQVFDEIREKYPNSWNEALDDYLILFPETADVRIKLQHRSIEINQFLSDIHSDLLTPTMFNPDSTNKEDMIGKFYFYHNYVLNQFGLMEDLRIYIQNRCLSELTGNTVPERVIKDKSLPHIFKTDSGLLDIKNNDKGISKIVQALQKDTYN